MIKRIQPAARCLSLLVSVAISSAFAASPPDAVNYQGVLRNAAGDPISGTVDMELRLFDAVSAGSEILIDRHLAAGSGGVAVDGGLFSVPIGGGTVSDGPGAGSYTTVAAVFRDFQSVWLQVTVAGDTLSPRTRVRAVAYAANASNLQGKSASQFVDTSSTPQTKSARLTLGDGVTVNSGETLLTGPVKITSGAPGEGKVLTSDASGSSSWTTLPLDPQLDEWRSLVQTVRSPDGFELPVAGLAPLDCSAQAATLSFTINAASMGTVIAFVGSDTISDTFVYRVAFTSANTALDPEAQLAGNGRLTITRAAGTTTFSGLITEFGLQGVSGGIATYVAQLEPTLSRLGRRSDYRIFQAQSATSVLNTLASEAGVADRETRFTKSYPIRDNIVQYGDDNLAFYKRVADADGVHFHFEEGVSADKLVLGDANSGFATIVGSFSYFGDNATPPTPREFISTFGAPRRMSTKNTRIRSHEFDISDSAFTGTATSTVGEGEWYRYDPASEGTTDTNRMASDLLETEGARRRIITGGGNVASLKAGSVFTVADTTTAGFSGNYVITTVAHYAQPDTANNCVRYGNAFLALPSTVPWRPSRRVVAPIASGPITATVTGPSGQTRYVSSDGLARIRVKFHWDKTATNNETTSGWVPVATPPGKAQQDVFVPNIGDEVLIDFVDGDPARPVVVGSLVNNSSPALFTTSIYEADAATTLDGFLYMAGDSEDITNRAQTIHFSDSGAAGGFNTLKYLDTSRSATPQFQLSAGLSVAGAVNVSTGGASITGGLTVPSGDLTVSAGKVTGPNLDVTSVNLDLYSDASLRTMLDNNNNQTSAIATWYHDGTFTNTLKLADLSEAGNFRIRGTLSENVAFDLAESFLAAEPLASGELVRLDPALAGAVRRSRGADDADVIGIVSERPGVLLGGAPFDAVSLQNSWGDGVVQEYQASLVRLRDVVIAQHPEWASAIAGLPGEEEPVAVQDAIESACLQQFFSERFAPIALAGRVPVRVDASFGAVKPGDLLTPSPTPGMAMKLTGSGLVIARALSSLPAGKGKVLALVVPVNGANVTHSATQSSSMQGASQSSSVGTRSDAAVSGNLATLSTLSPAESSSGRSSGMTEWFATAALVSPGDVVSIDPISGHLIPATEPSDPRVVGIATVGADPATLDDSALAALDTRLGGALTTALRLQDPVGYEQARRELVALHRERVASVALGGTTSCKVDASYGAIKAGDLLTTSPTPGHAMRAVQATPGTIVGKALEAVEAGTAVIRVLVMAR